MIACVLISATTYPVFGAVENAYILPSHPIPCESQMSAMVKKLFWKNPIFVSRVRRYDMIKTGIIAES
jgi:hypothetical protein